MLLTCLIILCMLLLSKHRIIASAPSDQDSNSKTTPKQGEYFNVNISLLRGATNTRQRRERRIAVEGNDNEGQNDRVTVFILFLFGSQNAASTSWNISESIFSNTALDDNNLLPTVHYSAALGTYLSTTTDITETIQLLPGHYYQFNISDASDTDGTGVRYTWILMEPAMNLASGQVLAGQMQSAMIYVPTEEEAMANITMPSSAPSIAPTIDCVIRGGSCVTGSDCCSNRCSPELICYPDGTVHGDRDKLTQGEGGAAGSPGKDLDNMAIFP
jgi:hypothetical protein